MSIRKINIMLWGVSATLAGLALSVQVFYQASPADVWDVRRLVVLTLLGAVMVSPVGVGTLTRRPS